MSTWYESVDSIASSLKRIADALEKLVDRPPAVDPVAERIQRFEATDAVKWLRNSAARPGDDIVVPIECEADLLMYMIARAVELGWNVHSVETGTRFVKQ